MTETRQPGAAAMRLRAPFPYMGGKGRIAQEVWRAFGQPDVYAEPFAGSLAVLLARPEPRGREVVCDTDGHIVNFWRALRAAPHEVARWADYPTFHDDLQARHRWLVETAAARTPQLQTNPDWYDAQAAGWWVWGISNWIGGQWCKEKKVHDSIPVMGSTVGGQGVQVDRESIPHLAGRGVNVNRAELPQDNIGSGERLLPWFHQLAQRLAHVVVLNRPWTSALTDTVLMQTTPGTVTAVLLDPPYENHEEVYASEEGAPAQAAYDWAVAHGATIRIAYCGFAGDFALPAGWRCFERVLRHNVQKQTETIFFSPACLHGNEPRQAQLL